MNHTAFFGDGEKTFALTTEMIHELERTTGGGIMALYGRFSRLDAHFSDLIEVIRTGLIGGGTSPEEAHKLVGIYGRSMLVTDLYALAFDVLDARWSGKPEALEIPLDETDGSFPAPGDIEVWRGGKLERVIPAAATGDMSAAVSESLEDTGL